MPMRMAERPAAAARPAVPAAARAEAPSMLSMRRRFIFAASFPIGAQPAARRLFHRIACLFDIGSVACSSNYGRKRSAQREEGPIDGLDARTGSASRRGPARKAPNCRPAPGARDCRAQPFLRLPSGASRCRAVALPRRFHHPARPQRRRKKHAFLAGDAALCASQRLDHDFRRRHRRGSGDSPLAHRRRLSAIDPRSRSHGRAESLLSRGIARVAATPRGNADRRRDRARRSREAPGRQGAAAERRSAAARRDRPRAAARSQASSARRADGRARRRGPPIPSRPCARPLPQRRDRRPLGHPSDRRGRRRRARGRPAPGKRHGGGNRAGDPRRHRHRLDPRGLRRPDAAQRAQAMTRLALNEPIALPALRLSPRHYARALEGIVWREWLRFLGQRGRFFSALVRPLVWLGIFAAGFRFTLGVLIIPPYETYIPYEIYVAPGLAAMIQLFNGMQSSLSMVYDREMGSMRVLLTSPLPRWYLLTAKLL